VLYPGLITYAKEGEQGKKENQRKSIAFQKNSKKPNEQRLDKIASVL